MKNEYEQLIKLVNGIDLECSGADDDSMWICIDSDCLQFVVNEDGNIDVYEVHYSDMVTLVDTIEVYPNDVCDE